MAALDDRQVGTEVRRLREAARLSQAQVADELSRMGLAGMHPQTIAKVESGSRTLKYREAFALAVVLGVPLDAFGRAKHVVETEVAEALEAWNQADLDRRVAEVMVRELGEDYGKAQDAEEALIRAGIEGLRGGRDPRKGAERTLKFLKEKLDASYERAAEAKVRADAAHARYRRLRAELDDGAGGGHDDGVDPEA